MNGYDYLIKKYGKEAIKLSCQELEELGIHATKDKLEDLCKKYASNQQTKDNN